MLLLEIGIISNALHSLLRLLQSVKMQNSKAKHQNCVPPNSVPNIYAWNWKRTVRSRQTSCVCVCVRVCAWLSCWYTKYNNDITTTRSLPTDHVIWCVYFPHLFQGGLRAVVVTDIFQICTVLIGILGLFIKGAIDAGGIDKVFSQIMSSQRLQLWR